MTSELALALMLLVGAGLMVRSLAALRSVDAGFDPRGVLSMVVSVNGSAAAAPGQRAAFFTETLARLRALPGVQSASAINHLPVGGDLWTRSFSIEGRPIVRPEERPQAAYRVIMPDYFSTMRLPLVRGRDVTDGTICGRPVWWSSTSTWLAHSGRGGIHSDSVCPSTIRGTTRAPMADGRRRRGTRHAGVGRAARGRDLLPVSPDGVVSRGTRVALHVSHPGLRSPGDPAALARRARAAVWSIDSGVSVSDVATMDATVDEALARPRFQFVLLGLFAGVALVLAAAGIYSVMSYAIARRTQEIGLRLTLGAQRGDVLRLVLAGADASGHRERPAWSARCS